MATIVMPAPKLSGGKFEGVDFSGQNLSKQDLSHSVFKSCVFDKADLRQANCSFSDFSLSSFVDTDLGYTNFMRSKMAGCIWRPKDCYGCTLTFSCETFRGVRISQLWWYAVLSMWTSMDPDRAPVKENLSDNLISCIGANRYVRLKHMLQQREL